MNRTAAPVFSLIVAIYCPFCTPSVRPTLPPSEVHLAELWQGPHDLASRDRFHGPWGREDAPDAQATYTFVQRKQEGTNPGLTVGDPLGRERLDGQIGTLAPQADQARDLPVLWREPKDIDHRDLFYGPGGEAHQPSGIFTFVGEDLDGSNPKFNVRDSTGMKWKIKLGAEARPETAATRLVWAVGYSADEDYFLREVMVSGMPVHLHRGRQLVGANGTMRDVRLKREPDDRKKIGNWQWRNNPFSGTRELNGLRVLMAVINNWDLKDVNNAIRGTKRGSAGVANDMVYEVGDLGASFGSAGIERTDHSKGNLDAYSRTTFITKVTPDEVDFNVPRRPDWIVLVNVRQFFMRLGLRWIGRQIPRQDAKWMGHLLAQLSSNQIRDAFRAAGYSPQEIDGFAAVLESRIAQLNQL